MSGIAGIWALDGRPVDPASLEKMMHVIRYRGPDGSGSWNAGSIALGHQQLCTTPESLNEHQPLQSQDGNLCLTADARVDNRAELRADLEAHGVRLRIDTDAELILGAYEVWGEDCPVHILGDFAFALWDGRRRQLFCARDPVGARAFYYHHGARTFRFASIPSALFADGTLSREPNTTQMVLYLLKSSKLEETLDKAVYRLPPAQRLVLRDGRVRTDRYWDADPGRIVRYGSDEEYAEHFLHVFRDAVRVRLRSHAPVGANLSGGLDSSAVVCVAQTLVREGTAPTSGFESYSLVYDGLPCNERPYIEEVLRASGVRGYLFPHEEIHAWLDFERAGSMTDLSYFPTLASQAPLFQTARERGARTMLSGVGGDALLNHGQAHLTDLWRQGNLRQLIAQVQQDAPELQTSAPSLFLKHCLKATVPGRMKDVLRPLLARLLWDSRVPSWINTTTLRHSDLLDGKRLLVSKIRFPSLCQQVIYDQLVHGWATNNALAEIQNLGAHFGIELRHPFYDRRVVEFLLAIPWEQRWHGGLHKRILRAGLAGILPELIRKRKDKAPFACIMEGEFRARQADKAERLLQTSVLGELGIIRGSRLRRLFKSYRSGDNRALSNFNFLMVFWLELWCRSKEFGSKGGGSQ
jgi:asparagine synthase (glutamine-hydrolysing)